jgi:hypothetical protein
MERPYQKTKGLQYGLSTFTKQDNNTVRQHVSIYQTRHLFGQQRMSPFTTLLQDMWSSAALLPAFYSTRGGWFPGKTFVSPRRGGGEHPGCWQQQMISNNKHHHAVHFLHISWNKLLNIVVTVHLTPQYILSHNYMLMAMSLSSICLNNYRVT